MQNQRLSLINHGTKFVSTNLKRLFEPLVTALPKPLYLLNPQPAFQRRLFIKKALDQHLLVYLQLMPKTAAGHPVAVKGYLSMLESDRYLIQYHNLNYIFSFDQLRYIAHPTY